LQIIFGFLFSRYRLWQVLGCVFASVFKNVSVFSILAFISPEGFPPRNKAIAHFIKASTLLCLSSISKHNVLCLLP